MTAVEITDPGCVWCWASEPILRELREPSWRRVFGVPVRTGTAEELRQTWLPVAEETGATIPDRLTHIPDALFLSRAARAAEHQGRARAEAALLALRESIFVEGEPADTRERLHEVLGDVLDVERLVGDLSSPDVIWSVDADRAEARRPRPGALTRHEDGVERYPFPTLLIGDQVVSGWHALTAVAA